MIWTKTRVFIWKSEGADFRITESEDNPGRPFRLASFDHLDDEPIYFASLRQAQAHAATLAELAQLRAEVERLRVSAAPAAVAAPVTAASPTPGQRAAATRRNRATAVTEPATVTAPSIVEAAPAA